MSTTIDPRASERNFTNLSDTESTCQFCGNIIQSRMQDFLTLAEDVHSQFCAARPKPPSAKHRDVWYRPKYRQ
jgi:hypothetical protein